jgi:predicted AAA+ superfamily ATPase
MSMPTIFDLCIPRSVILTGNLPASIFAADLWDVITGQAHPDYQDPRTFFSGTYPTEKLRILVKDVTERLAGMQGINPVFVLETGFGGGKTHSLIATVHAATQGHLLRDVLSSYGIRKVPDTTRVAVFVGENSDPSKGKEIRVDSELIRTFTPWGQIALMAGGKPGYDLMRENDILGIAPSRDDLEKALGSGPVLILIDELVLYMARTLALPPDHPRAALDSQ